MLNYIVVVSYLPSYEKEAVKLVQDTCNEKSESIYHLFVFFSFVQYMKNEAVMQINQT